MSVRESSFILTAADGHPIEVISWLDDGPDQRPVKAIVQIAHGMGEHSKRYRALAQSLVDAGCAVYASEHRGHGAGAQSRGELGDFGAGGFAGLAHDMAQLSLHAKAAHPQAPLVLVGHSMGSFAAQLYVLDYSELIDGVALSGTTAIDLMLQARSAGWKLEDANAGVTDPRTPFDWLSRDPAVVDAYLADALCGFTIVAGSMQSMGADCMRTADISALRRIRPDLPLLAFTGAQDPVNNFLEWFEPLLVRYRAAGLTDVSSHVYGGARHEVFNETNRAEVVANLIAWIERVARR